MESGFSLGFPSNRPKKATFDFEKRRFGGPRRSKQTPRGLPQRHRHPADSPGREVSNDTAKFGTHLGTFWRSQEARHDIGVFAGFFRV